jgi:hypothetical protein
MWMTPWLNVGMKWGLIDFPGRKEEDNSFPCSCPKTFS